ncbi:hypothetical protein HDA32_003137 [Spinactinospora alkalitolerans]|uniref:Uncharacterized protein n=1 Tax=Spinactinospora alkalitolerans TaxID=687207 RepID=A0A852TXJ6_9ACTN|nr:hypothetical protein [Spinactinospora alkalitolerans]
MLSFAVLTAASVQVEEEGGLGYTLNLTLMNGPVKTST